MKKKDEQNLNLAKGIEELKALVEEGRAQLEAKFSPVELRVARNSSKYKRAEEAIKEAEIGVDMLLDAWDDICSLSEYMDSGRWKEDFEADERGEISKEIDRGVLSEDGLYNALYRFQDVLAQMSLIVDHVDVSEEEENHERRQ
jgi:hypothetical protein